MAPIPALATSDQPTASNRHHYYQFNDSQSKPSNASAKVQSDPSVNINHDNTTTALKTDVTINNLQDAETAATETLISTSTGTGITTDENPHIITNPRPSDADSPDVTANGSGVWRIRKRERSSVIEVFKIEESGHGGILSDKFLEGRRNAGVNSRE